MKIAEYNDMMSYLTRQNFNSGTKKPRTVSDLIKSKDIVTGDKYKPKNPKLIQTIRAFEEKYGFRKKESDGGPQIIPPSKPAEDPLEVFKKQADLFLQGSFGSSDKTFFNNLIEQEYDKALDAGVLPEEALSFLKERSKKYRKLAEEGRMQGEPAILGPSYGREDKAIGGGAFVGEDLGTREGFNFLEKQKASDLKRDRDRAARKEKLGIVQTTKDGKQYVVRPGRKRDLSKVPITDDEALVKEWRNSLKKKNPVPWETFLRNKFDKTTAQSLRGRIRNDPNIDLDPKKEFEKITQGKMDSRLEKIKKLVKQHNDSDNLLYTKQQIFKKIGVSNITQRDYPELYAALDELDKPEDKVKKAFDKIITEDLVLRAPKLRETKAQITKSNIIYQMISDMVSPKGKEISKRYNIDSRFIQKVLNTHDSYLNIKDDFDYFAREAKPFIGKKFKEAFELAKYRRGGLDIKNLGDFVGGYAKPEQNIYNFAIRHAYLNHRRKAPSQIKFFKINKKGEKVGAPLNFDTLPRDPKSFARVMNTDKYGFQYKNKFFTKQNLRAGEGIKSGLFEEVYEMTKKGRMPVPDPNNPDGPKITLRKLLENANDRLTVGHDETLGGVAGEPFKNLRIESGKFNVAMFAAYNNVTDPGARKMIVKNLIGNFPDATNDPDGYEKAFIESKSQLAKDLFNSPRAVLDLPTYYRGAGQKVLADMGKDFFSKSKSFKQDIAQAADIDLKEYEANQNQYKKNLVLQLARKKGLSPKKVEEEVSNVQKVIRKMQGQMNSGMDPKLLVEYLGAEVKDLAAFGQKYGGDALGKIGTTVSGIDLPIFQVMFGSMYDIEQDSPLWLTIPAAFTDEVANIFNLYNKSEGKFGLGKAKDFGKFLASSFVPRAMRSPIFKAASKVGKMGTFAGPLLEAGAGAYRFEQMKDRRDDAIRQFNIPIDIANKGFRDYIRSTVPEDSLGYLDVDVDKGTAPIPESPGLPGIMRGIKQFGSMVNLADDPYAEKESIYTRGKENPMSLDRALYPNRQNFADGMFGLDVLKLEDEALQRALNAFKYYKSMKGKKNFTDYLKEAADKGYQFRADGGLIRQGFADGPKDPSKRTFLKLLSLIPAGIAGLASIRFGPKKVKNLMTKIKKLKNTTTQMPDWFPTFLNKFRNEGKAENVFKQKKVEVTEEEYNQAIASGKGKNYYTDVARTDEYKANNPDHMDYFKLEDTDELIYTKYTNEKFPGVQVDDMDGNVDVMFENDYSQPVTINYTAPGAKGPETGRADIFVQGESKMEIKPKGDFVANDVETYATDPDGGYDTEDIIANSLDDMMEGTTRQMEEYATGKPVKKLSRGEGRVIEAEIRAEQAAERAAEEAAEAADDFD